MNKENYIKFAKNLIWENRKMRGFPNLAEVFIAEPKMLPGLIALLENTYEYPFPQHASWLLTHIAKKNPDSLLPYLKILTHNVVNTLHESVRRNILGAMCNLPLIEHKEAELLSCLLEWIANPNTKPAIVMYSLEKLVQFCHKYPELRVEIEAILNFQDSSDLSPAIRVAKRKFLTGK